MSNIVSDAQACFSSKVEYRAIIWYLYLKGKAGKENTRRVNRYLWVFCTMFDIQYLIKECLDTRAILNPGIKHVLKQGMEIVTASVNWKWDRLVTYRLALVPNIRLNMFLLDKQF